MLATIALMCMFACTALANDLDLSLDLSAKLKKIGFEPESLLERTTAFVELKYKYDKVTTLKLKLSTKEYKATIEYKYQGIPLKGECTINKEFTKKKCKVSAKITSDKDVTGLLHESVLNVTKQELEVAYELNEKSVSKSTLTLKNEFETDVAGHVTKKGIASKSVTTEFILTKDLKGLLPFNPLEKFFVGDFIKPFVPKLPDLSALGKHNFTGLLP